MKVGDKIQFEFAGKKKDAQVHKLFDNSVYLKVDFDKHKGKIVKRKLNEVSGGKGKKKK